MPLYCCTAVRAKAISTVILYSSRAFRAVKHKNAPRPRPYAYCDTEGGVAQPVDRCAFYDTTVVGGGKVRGSSTADSFIERTLQLFVRQHSNQNWLALAQFLFTVPVGLFFEKKKISAKKCISSSEE